MVKTVSRWSVVFGSMEGGGIETPLKCQGEKLPSISPQDCLRKDLASVAVVYCKMY
jgi:hypothetical protein